MDIGLKWRRDDSKQENNVLSAFIQELDRTQTCSEGEDKVVVEGGKQRNLYNKNRL